MNEVKINVETEQPVDKPSSQSETSKKEADSILERRLEQSNSADNQKETNNSDAPTSLEPNNKYYRDGHTYETDDNGNVYTNDGKLLPNTAYTLNGNTYTTDEKGRIIICESNPKSTPENQRDNNAQTTVGGEDRKSGDQGGHIVGRDMGGDGGLGNLMPMDSRINQSDYKRMENDTKKTIETGKNVQTKTEIIYSSDSERADKIITTVTVDGKDTVYTFDNNLDGSLMDELKETCSESDIKTVQDVLDETGGQISSIKEEYDADEKLEKTTVSITYAGDDGKNYRKQIVINNNGGASQ